MGGKQGIDRQIDLRKRFHVILRILRPISCKQRLRVKIWKAEVRAEKANKLKTKMNKSEHSCDH